MFSEKPSYQSILLSALRVHLMWSSQQCSEVNPVPATDKETEAQNGWLKWSEVQYSQVAEPAHVPASADASAALQAHRWHFGGTSEFGAIGQHR